MRGFIGFATSEIERQQRRKRQKRNHRRRHQQFTTAWKACFRDDLAACNQALSYRHIHHNDRTRLEDKRRRLLAAEHEAAVQARYRDLMRQRAERAEINRRRAEQQAEATRRRRLKEKEQQRRAKLRAFKRNRSACRNHNMVACELALGSLFASGHDRVELRRLQNEAQTYQHSRVACKTGTRDACRSALASPALVGTDRKDIERWYAEAHPINRAMDSVSSLPTSTVITGTFALFLSFALDFMVIKHRAAANGPDDTSNSDNEPDASPQKGTVVSSLSSFIKRFLQTPSDRQKPPSSDRRASDPPFKKEIIPEPAPAAPRDTPGAIAALELAEAYIEEVREAARPAHDDKLARREQLNTLALAAKQLTLAEELDPDAELVVESDQGEVSFTIGALKANALILEARAYDDHDTKHALPPLRQAIEVDPTNATAHYLLGMIEAANMNRARAIEALQTAAQLEPDNLTFRKELNHAENIGGAEAAAFKATRLGERAYDTSITAWNIFAITWNILTFPLRALSAIARLMRVG